MQRRTRRFEKKKDYTTVGDLQSWFTGICEMNKKKTDSLMIGSRQNPEMRSSDFITCIGVSVMNASKTSNSSV